MIRSKQYIEPLQEGRVKSIKVVGLSGAGKTTLIASILKYESTISCLSYGEYLKKYGYEGVSAACEKFLSEQEGLVLMDEHLEIGDEDLARSYLEENTCGIFFLEVSYQNLIQRRINDKSRERDISIEKITSDHIKAKRRALHLADLLNIPIRIVVDTTIEENIKALESFICEVYGG